MVVWGGSPIATKVAVTHLDPMMVAVLRTLWAAALLLPVACAGRLPRPLTARDWGPVVVSGGCGFIAFPILFTYGIRLTTASHAALILALAPVSTGVIAAVLERHRVSARWIAGVLVALAGEAALVLFRLGLAGAPESVAGDALVLCGLVCGTTGYVVGARATRVYGPWATTVWGIVLSGAAFLPVFAVLALRAPWASVAPSEWVAVAYLAVMVSVVGYVAWYWALAAGGIARVGLAQFGQPIVTVALAVVMLGEPVTIPLAAAGALILSGIALARD
jgi:drug/metabolite transporter (DMT)-like permease